MANDCRIYREILVGFSTFVIESHRARLSDLPKSRRVGVILDSLLVLLTNHQTDRLGCYF